MVTASNGRCSPSSGFPCLSHSNSHANQLSTNTTVRKSKSKLYYDRQSLDQSVLVLGYHLGSATTFSVLIIFRQSRFVTVGRPLWQEVGSVVYSCCWTSPAQSSSVRVPRDLWPYFTASNLRLPNLKGQVPAFLSPTNRVTQLYPQALGWLLVIKVKVTLRLTVSQSVCLGVEFTLEIVTRY
jgi:hypothetical protein